MTTSIVGTSFRGPAAQNALARLKAGEPLRVVREPNNKYDRWACAVYRFDLHMGYLSRGVAKDMAALIDGGTSINIRCIKAGTGLVRISWSDEGLQSPADTADGFDTFDPPTEDKPRTWGRLTPPKPPKVKPPEKERPRHFFPEIDLPPEEIDTRPDPWE